MTIFIIHKRKIIQKLEHNGLYNLKIIIFLSFILVDTVTCAVHCDVIRTYRIPCISVSMNECAKLKSFNMRSRDPLSLNRSSDR